MSGAPVLAHAAAPALGISGWLILNLLAWAVLFALILTYDHSIGALLRELARKTRGIRWIGGPIADAVDAIDQYVMRQMGAALDGLETSVAKTWGALAWLVRETGDAMVAYAADTYNAIAGLVYGEIPTQIDAKTKPLDTRLDRVNRRTSAQARAEALARTRGIDAVNRDLTQEERARQRGIDAVNERITSLVMPRVRAVEQGLQDVWGFTRRNLRTRIGNLERALAAGTIGAVALAAITRVFPYWQCSNVRRFNRGLCRSPFGALDWLFALAAFALVALDPERMAQLGEDLTDELGGIIETMSGI